MKYKYSVFILLAIGIVIIHVNSFAFPHSILLRHMVLFIFIGYSAYFVYVARRRQKEEYDKLKKFLRVCSWCKKICTTDPETKEENWVSFEEYMTLEHNFKSSHGICPHCYDLIDKNHNIPGVHLNDQN